MKSKSRLKPFTALALCAVTVPLLASACNSDNPLASAADGLCCKTFVVGADLSDADFGLKGEVKGQFVALAQASADLSAVANGALADVSVACESIARDVGASDDAIALVEAKSVADRPGAWCQLAADTISGSFQAKGKFKANIGVDFQAPTCSASVSAQADCAAKCDVSGKCEASADVKCEGGELPSVDCTGSCKAEVKGGDISCTGSCSGECTGTCTATADVAIDCEGKCDGSCTVDGTAASGSAVQADGTCKGKCDGTCDAGASAKAECKGTCNGSCNATCKATSPTAKFECNGTCDIKAGTPPKCQGSAKLDCDVSADCKANCSASVKAKAQCTPPKVAVVIDAKGSLETDAKAQLNVAIASLETNLPQIFVVLEARGASFSGGVKDMFDASVKLSGNVGDLSGEAVLCVPPIVAALTTATGNFKTALDGSILVAGAVHVGS
ncbi:MAG: hypothetical protein ABIQ16_25045 [Polyangiaceae bacterium]